MFGVNKEAIITSHSTIRSMLFHSILSRRLRKEDSNTWLDRIGGSLIITGDTGTNTGDVAISLKMTRSGVVRKQH